MKNLNSQKGIAPIIAVIILAVIFIGGGAYYFKQQQAKQVSKSNVVDEAVCSDTKKIAETIQNSVSHIGKTEISQSNDSPPNKQYSWKLTEKDPFRTYNTNLPYLIAYSGQKTQITDQSFKDTAISKILALGYIQNEVNTKPLKESDITVSDYSRYGFTKNNERIVIDIGGDITENSGITIRCGTADKEADDFYDAVIKNSPKLTPNSMLNIWEKRDNVVKIDVSNYPGGYGTGQYWIKKGNDWKNSEYEGNGNLRCDILEKEHAGKGFPCYDKQTLMGRTVK